MKPVTRSGRRRSIARLCCGGFGLLALACLARLQHLTVTESSSSDPAEDVGRDWTGRKLMQDGIENHTLEPPRA
ncbi:sodium/potassium/calcium exchanger 3, partial [Tachysurus ichikawai]